MSSLVLQRTHAVGPQRCGGQTASRPGPLPIAPRACFSGNSHSRFERSTNQIGPQVLWRTERKCPHVSTSATATENVADDFDDEDLEDIGLGGGEVEAIDESQLGPLPEVRHQGPMHIKDRKLWRARAEALAKEKKLIRVQVGQLGITPAFLRATSDVLQKHGLVRVKLGEGSGVERANAADVLERYLDAVCVHQIGFTITLYRRQGLPRPTNTQPLNEEQRVLAAAELAAAEAEAAAASAEAAARREAKKRAGQQKPQQRPPEFSVM